MQINLMRYSESHGATLGLLFIDNVFACYTLEDVHRETKIKGETCIPTGTYKVALKSQSRFDSSMRKHLGDDYKGMLELQDVPNFSQILIHAGNRTSDTAGCLLVGNKINNNRTEKAFLGDSMNALKRIYTQISSALVDGDEVEITIIDL